MKRYSLLLILIFCCMFTMGQADDPGFPGGDPDVPLDDGIGFLVVAGSFYGIKKITKLRS